MRISDWSSDVCSSDLGAGNQNSIGYYKIDAEGHVTDVQFVWANASAEDSGGDLVPGQSSASLDVGAGDRFGLFLVSDGFSQNDFDDFESGHFEFRNADGTPATVESVEPKLIWVTDDG